MVKGKREVYVLPMKTTLKI